MLPLLFCLAHAEPTPTPDSVQWNHRLVVLVAASADHPAVHASIERLAADHAGVADRRLRVVTVLDGSVDGLTASVPDLSARWRLDPDVPFEALLVGLDGRVKDRRTLPVDVAAWFARIDAMPMRAEELRNRLGAGPKPASERDSHPR